MTLMAVYSVLSHNTIFITLFSPSTELFLTVMVKHKFLACLSRENFKKLMRSVGEVIEKIGHGIAMTCCVTDRDWDLDFFE